MKTFVLIYFLLATSIIANAQQKITISGFVNDSITGEALIGASVYETRTLKGCITNEYGFYSLSIVKVNEIILEASYVGYSKQHVKLEKGNQTFNFNLTPGIRINEVTLQYEAPKIITRKNINATQLGINEINKLPTLFGENDLIQAMRLMPGVQAGDEGKSQLFVRGGSPDQNLVLVDDVPLYYISHFSGLFSIFNSDAINNVEMIKGGFPARYGGRLSSVVDVRMKDGNLYKHEGNCTIGLLSSRISYEGPVQKGRSSYIISARRSVLPIMKLVTDNLLSNNFYDLNGKINFKLNENDRLFMSLYQGGDNVKIKQYDSENKNNELVFSDKNNWGNSLAAIRWSHIYSQVLFSNFIVSGVNYQFSSSVFHQEENDSITYQTQNELTSGIIDYNAAYDLKWFATPKYSLRGGVKSTLHIFTPNNESLQQSTSLGLRSDTTYISKIAAVENSLYVENEFEFRHLSGNIGGRLVGYIVNSKTFFYAEPRISVSYEPFRWFQMNVSYAQMNQFIHLLSYSNAGFPNDYWMPATELAQPEYSEQTSMGINLNFPSSRYSLSLISYFKKMGNLVAFKNGASLYGNLDRWENVVELGGAGTSKGIELLFQKTEGKTTGWISTTLSKTTRQFENINNGKEYPFKYDRRLNLSIAINHEFNKRVDLSLVWNYGSGYPVTLAVGKYRFNNDSEVLIWGPKNSFRMRDYHRLDVALNFPCYIGRIKSKFSVSVLNIYNRKNPYYYFYMDKTAQVGGSDINGNPSTEFIGDKGLKLYQQSLFPFLPSFSYSFKF